jgi:integrase
VPLAPAAIEFLNSMKSSATSIYVFPSQKTGKPIVGLQKIWTQLRTSARIEGIRLHDLRHSFASAAIAGGESLYLVGQVLGHKQARTTEVYAHLQSDPLKAVAHRAATSILGAINPAKPDHTDGHRPAAETEKR